MESYAAESVVTGCHGRQADTIPYARGLALRTQVATGRREADQ